MRAFVLAIAMSVLMAVGYVSYAHAVGFYSVGKEDCKCSPLVARGIVPDTLNQIMEALVLTRLGGTLERFAIDIREMMTQLGSKPTTEVTEAVVKKESPAEIDEPTRIEKKIVTPEKTNKSKKEVKEPTKKKRLKAPTKALQRS